jgi:hypothetical protein
MLDIASLSCIGSGRFLNVSFTFHASEWECTKPYFGCLPCSLLITGEDVVMDMATKFRR